MRASFGLVGLLIGWTSLATSCGNAGDTYACNVQGLVCTEYVAGYSQDAARVDCGYTPRADFSAGQCPSGQVARCTVAAEAQVAVTYMYPGYLDGTGATAQTVCSHGDLSTP